jgi:hypothetical protein
MALPGVRGSRRAYLFQRDGHQCRRYAVLEARYCHYEGGRALWGVSPSKSCIPGGYAHRRALCREPTPEAAGSFIGR